jgi:hypothetical protein
MLIEQKLGEQVFNNLPKEYYKDIPKMPSQVRVRLHPNKFKIKRVDVVTSEDQTARASEIAIRPIVGETQLALSSLVWVNEMSEGGYPIDVQKHIAVINGGLTHLLVFPKNVGEITLNQKNGLDQQIYYYMMIWTECKNSINGNDQEFYCEMIDSSRQLDLSIQKENKQTDAKVLIKDCNDLDFIFNIAGTLGYNGEKSLNECKAFLNALAATDSAGVIDAFSKPDLVKLRMTIVNAFSEKILQYKPKNGKIGIAGDAGRDFVSSDVNEDFNSRVSKLLVFFGMLGNEQDLIALKSAMEKKALAPLNDDVLKPEKKATLPKQSETVNKLGTEAIMPLIPEEL